MFERPAKGSGASTRAKALLVLLGVTALGAYYVGRQSISNAPVAAFAQPQQPVAKPVAFAASVSPPIAAAATSSVNNNPAPTIRAQPATVHAPKNLRRQRFPLGERGSKRASLSPATKP
ncbi:hypothetical protein V1283_000484 [Bradyrhizobium sp. AZCC 2262]